MSEPKLEKAVVFGATSAIARETIRLLAARRAELVLVGRGADRLETIAADARVRGAARADVLVADLDLLEGQAGLVDRAAEALGRIDVALLAQGVLGEQARAAADPEALHASLHANFVAPAVLLQLLANRLAAQGSGTLVAISSVAGDRGRQSNYAYGSAKAGLTAFLAGLRNALFRRGVHVVTVKPGFVDTPMTAAVPKNALFTQPAVVARAIVRAVERRQDVVYVPRFWALVMLVIRHLPERIFKRLSL